MLNICTIFKQLSLGTGRLLYPPQCLLCDAAGQAGLNLCTGCHDELPWNRHACDYCALPLPPSATGVRCCANCQQQRAPYDRAWSAFRYHGAVRWLHRRLKFQAGFAQGRLLSELLTEALQQTMTDTQTMAPDVIMVMPLHSYRLIRRGFNQSLELIRPLAGQFHIELDYHSLRRTRATLPQTDQPAKLRHLNVRGAFRCKRDLSGLNIALFDDVVTTGATVAEAARVLRRAGAREISVWSLARTSA